MPAPTSDVPLPDSCDAVIIGAGFAGIAMGRQLDRAGISDFVILERAGGPGGVWRANRYPGAACDVPSHLYSFSFFPNPDWSRKFSPQAEILAYLDRAADAFDLRRRMRFGCAVTGLTFNQDEGRWRVTLSDGRMLSARAVISAVGQLSEPVIPAIPGLDGFEGAWSIRPSGLRTWMSRGRTSPSSARRPARCSCCPKWRSARRT